LGQKRVNFFIIHPLEEIWGNWVRPGIIPPLLKFKEGDQEGLPKLLVGHQNLAREIWLELFWIKGL